MPLRVVPEPEPLWQALADPTRRAILDALRDGPRTTGALAERFPTTRFAVMKHLNVLAAAHLITVERRGRERLNHLNPVPLQQAYERWVRPFAAPSASALLRLAERTAMTTTTPYGLDVRAEHRIHSDAERTWDALLDLASWWPPCWEDGAHLEFEPHVGGRLGTVHDGGGALWGVVSVLRPARELVVDGTMGIPGPVAGQWRMRLEPEGATTLVTVEHRVLGPVDDDDREGFTTRWPETLAALGAAAAR